MKKFASIALLSALFMISFAGCNQPVQQTSTDTTPTVTTPTENVKPDTTVKPEETTKPVETVKPEETPQVKQYSTLQDASAVAILALKNKDMKTLAAMAGTNGVRFSPYSYIDLEKDVVLTPIVLENAYILSRTFVWGSYDGSGEPIDLPFAQYFDKFVYDQDFMNAEQIKYNEIIGTGNTTNNLKEAYPNAEFVEYHFSGFDKQYEGMDWESLRLVFEKKDGAYNLVGIIHDGWTV